MFNMLQRPPDRFVFALQLALALVITYFLALSFDWERPRWAAFAVITVAMPHVGMSLARAGQRLLGTLLAAAVAITIVALFPQQRWHFVLALSIWLATCTYLMGFSRHSYFWQCAGFVGSIIAISAANAKGGSFSLAVDRTLETSLGVIVYSLVTMLVWPVKTDKPAPANQMPGLFFPDRDLLVAALRVAMVYYLAFIAIVYIPAFPTGLMFLAPLAAFLMALASMPQLPVKALYGPIFMGLALASMVYMLVMPELAGFYALGLLLFVVGFIIAYRYYAPEETLTRLAVLAIFASLTGISNDQSYTFATISNNVLTFALLLLFLHIATLVPETARPEDNFIGLLARFRAAAGQLAQAESQKGWIDSWRRAYHRHEIATIPSKLEAWHPHLSPVVIETADEQIKTVLQSVSGCREKLLLRECEPEEASSRVADLGDACALIDWSAWSRTSF